MVPVSSAAVWIYLYDVLNSLGVIPLILPILTVNEPDITPAAVPQITVITDPGIPRRVVFVIVGATEPYAKRRAAAAGAASGDQVSPSGQKVVSSVPLQQKQMVQWEY